MLVGDLIDHSTSDALLKGLLFLWCLLLCCRGESVCCCSEAICSYLSRLRVGEEKEPKSNSNKDFQHNITSFSLTIRVMVARARPVCSLIDL